MKTVRLPLKLPHGIGAIHDAVTTEEQRLEHTSNK